MAISDDFDLVIFDCDGVLVDSEPIFNRAHAEILGECGYRVTADSLDERFCGMADAEMLGIIEREWGRRLPADYAARFAAVADAECEKALVAFPGIHSTLDGLGAPVCVASSGTPDRIRKSLGIVGLLDRFVPHLFSAVMVAKGKPAPDLFFYAARNMGVAASRCVVVEDSIAGVRAAMAAEMPVVGFCGGGHCRPSHGEALSRHGAAVVISDMGDLLPSLGSLGRALSTRAR